VVQTEELSLPRTFCDQLASPHLISVVAAPFSLIQELYNPSGQVRGVKPLNISGRIRVSLLLKRKNHPVFGWFCLALISFD
jgi:hypothetical protein